MTTPEVIEKEFQMKPEEFDKQFMAWLEPQTAKTTFVGGHKTVPIRYSLTAS